MIAELLDKLNDRMMRHVKESGNPHPEQGYCSALGILRLGKKHGEALEHACDKAFRIHSSSYRTVKTLLAQRMASAPCW